MSHRSVPALLTVAALALIVTTPAGARTLWLCRPGLSANPCAAPETATVLSSSGARSPERRAGRGRPRVDCFYVYPTASLQPRPNAARMAEPAVRNVATAQASRFSSVCRVYAPLYRQATLAVLSRPPEEQRRALDRAYADVAAAWHAYRRAHPRRGVVLLGHSQGAVLLRRLVRREIDPRPAARRRLVSAILLGGNVKVQAGRRTGGDFRHIPACRNARERACVIAYSAFASAPTAAALFGRTGAGDDPVLGGPRGPGLRILCVNPPALLGHPGASLRPYFTVGSAGGLYGTLGTVAGIPTTWLALPHLYRSRCRSAGRASWLQVDDGGGPADARPRMASTPPYGLHLEDVNLALGDLVAIARREATAWKGGG